MIHAELFALAIMDKIDSTFLKSIKRMVGSVDQFIDSTDIFYWNEALRSIDSVYDLG